MLNKADIVREARSWVGVPYVHQHRSRQGVDCAGLVIVVAKKLGLVSKDFDVNGYDRVPDGFSLIQNCNQYLKKTTDPEPGDIVVIRWENDPQHLAIVGDYLHGGLSIIHALNRGSKGQVIEHRLTSDLRRNIVAVYSFI